MTLITIRPGPVLHVWQHGREVAAVPLSLTTGLALMRALAGALGREPVSQGQPQESKGLSRLSPPENQR